MKKFLFKATLFLFLFVVTFASPVIFEVAVRKHKLSLKLPKDTTILFIGDSQVERGVNDKLIPGSFNWAKPGDSYQILFVRTRELLEKNPQIHTVFVTASPVSLSENADYRIFGGGARLHLNIIFYRLEDFEDFNGETLSSALKNSGVERKTLLKSIASETFGSLKEFGGFNDFGDSSELLWKEIENGGKLDKERLSGDDRHGNEFSVKYLRKIVEFVRARGGRVIFLNPPIYHAEEFYDVPYFEALLQEKFPDVEFWDYATPPLFSMPENCFSDILHLNGRGAEVFSKELARRMKGEGIIGDSPQPEATVSGTEP